MAEQKKVPTRPLPKLNELDTQPFWQATKDKAFKYQVCPSSGKVVFYPRRYYLGCGSEELEWKTASGRATVYSYSVVRQSYHPFFRNLVPYAVAWIDLEEGPRILSNVVGVEDPLTDVFIGQEVEIEWEEHEALCIPLFRPVKR
ncbi:MAG: OB-fold domain-containing protein [Pseudomonadales bacterium]|nr:OB-fold domain-containing protein [Pseudomonadales bacterium]MBO6596108.1 OB-fold domain-containing protein [Pseudomonadales bacterium]MBO6822590.1 OB-fold domain-containing protein [Pseudomonadales bacterium]